MAYAFMRCACSPSGAAFSRDRFGSGAWACGLLGGDLSQGVLCPSSFLCSTCAAFQSLEDLPTSGLASWHVSGALQLLSGTSVLTCRRVVHQEGYS